MQDLCSGYRRTSENSQREHMQNWPQPLHLSLDTVSISLSLLTLVLISITLSATGSVDQSYRDDLNHSPQWIIHDIALMLSMLSLLSRQDWSRNIVFNPKTWLMIISSYCVAKILELSISLALYQWDFSYHAKISDTAFFFLSSLAINPGNKPGILPPLVRFVHSPLSRIVSNWTGILLSLTYCWSLLCGHHLFPFLHTHFLANLLAASSYFFETCCLTYSPTYDHSSPSTSLMAIFTSPTSFQNALVPRQLVTQTQTQMGFNPAVNPADLTTASNSHSGHPSFLYLVLLVFEAVLEVICVCLPGYLAAQRGMFDAEAQKLVANLNVTLFTPCLSMDLLSYAANWTPTNIPDHYSLYETRVATHSRETDRSRYHPGHLYCPNDCFLLLRFRGRAMLPIQETAGQLCRCHGGKLTDINFWHLLKALTNAYYFRSSETPTPSLFL